MEKFFKDFCVVLLSGKVLSKLSYTVPKSTVKDVAECKPGVIEVVLANLRMKVRIPSVDFLILVFYFYSPSQIETLSEKKPWDSEKRKSYLLLTKGSLHDIVTWYGINCAGMQVTQYDIQKKGTCTSPALTSQRKLFFTM